jgi:hypothetical protein
MLQSIIMVRPVCRGFAVLRAAGSGTISNGRLVMAAGLSSVGVGR